MTNELEQPTPDITIEKVESRRYVLTHHYGFRLSLTLAEMQAVHVFMAEQCGSNCDCYERGFREGQEAGNLYSRA